MRKWIVATGMALGVAAWAQAQGKVEVPHNFVGTWKASLQYCGANDDDSVLKITTRGLHYYEAGGAVVKVIRQGQQNATLQVLMQDETGASYPVSVRLLLSADGKRLTERTAMGDAVRYRCP